MSEADFNTGEWLMTWLTVFVGPIGLEDVGAGFWGWVLSGNIIAIIFVSVSRYLLVQFLSLTIHRFFLCPETGGKTLEEVDYLFQKPLAVSKGADLADLESYGEDKDERAPQIETRE